MVLYGGIVAIQSYATTVSLLKFYYNIPKFYHNVSNCNHPRSYYNHNLK